MTQMRTKIIAVAILALMVSHEAVAQARTDGHLASGKAPVTARVDASGRIVPLALDGRQAVQRVGNAAGIGADGQGAVTGRPVNPCPDRPALSRQEAAEIIGRVAREQRFSPQFVRAVAFAESRLTSNALSPRGAYGLMQLLPPTARGYGIDICDPGANVKGGIAFLRDLNRRYRNLFYVLAAYNAGEMAVLKYKGMPPYAETIGYVATVINEFYRWPAIGAGAAARDGAPDLDPGNLAFPEIDLVDYSIDMTSRSASSGGRRKRAAAWRGGMVMNFD